ncbi:hypothetical protein HMPREF9446_00233 [Bacteroides fluxus YIT 12057]|uniref:Uncharacterized protein n=1 Tax=Bacteroides fluxus YIT 12057 TaxID=763034 RepID=F3PNE7_9BACE|nr:hypothetical protein HMPREF9446_00233 [Bacteroides fluxus YIT 12057]
MPFFSKNMKIKTVFDFNRVIILFLGHSFGNIHNFAFIIRA